MLQWPTNPLVIPALATNTGKIKKVSLLGLKKNINYTQDETDLKVNFPIEKLGEYAWTLKLEGLW